MDAIKATKEMIASKILLGSDKYKYKIENGILYFYLGKGKWNELRADFLDFIELTFFSIAPKETLSDKIIISQFAGTPYLYNEEDIKEFIKKLKKNLGKDGEYTEEYNLRVINELTGPRFNAE